MKDLATRQRLSRLRAECILLTKKYGEARFDTQDGSWVYVPNFPIASGWNKSHVEILLDIPWGSPGYPSQAPQWFWTDSDLVTSDGRPISHFFVGSETERDYIDKNWKHFCVHVKAWRPAGASNLTAGHSLLSYTELISAIFRDRRTLQA